MLDNFPLSKGHTLVVPKRHITDLSELKDSEKLDVFNTIAKVEKALMETIGCEGTDLRQHFRPFLPETQLSIRHVHFHVIPRGYNDELFMRAMKYQRSIRQRLSSKEKKDMGIRILKNLE